MNGKFTAAVAVAMLSTFPLCQAATPAESGVIHFTGSIVERPCTTSPQSSGWRMDACPTRPRNSDFIVQRIQPASSLSSLNNTQVQARLVADSSAQGRYFDQQYTLVDNAGKPVTTGYYLITLSMP